jgi:chemotaxis protein MotB
MQSKRRKRAHEEHENHERWLVSYADFITLLFAFFVVMYAISQVNEGKYRVLSDSLMQAFKPDAAAGSSMAPPYAVPGVQLPFPHLRANQIDEARRRARAERLRAIAEQVLKALAPLVDAGQVRVTQSPRGIAVEINASMLFKSAQATLEPESTRPLIAVAQVLARNNNPIEVEGHTDREPISTLQFPSNWELSGARASSVVRLFIENGVTARRLIASGYADTRPVGSNETAEGRSRNRRVTVLIRPDDGEPDVQEQPVAEEPPVAGEPPTP